VGGVGCGGCGSAVYGALRARARLSAGGPAAVAAGCGLWTADCGPEDQARAQGARRRQRPAAVAVGCGLWTRGAG